MSDYQRTPQEKMVAIMRLINSREQGEVPDTKRVVVDSCEQVGMVEGAPSGDYFYPGLQLHMPVGDSRPAVETRGDVDVVVDQLAGFVQNVCMVTVETENMPARLSNLKKQDNMTTEERLRQFGLEVEESACAADKEEDGDLGPRMRFGPYDAARGQGVAYEPALVRDIVRHAVEDVWVRLGRDYDIVPDDRRLQNEVGKVPPELLDREGEYDEYGADGLYGTGREPGRHVVSDVRGLLVTRESSHWDLTAMSTPSRDPEFLVHAVKAAHHNSIPISVGERVRFRTSEESEWRSGVVADVRSHSRPVMARPTEIRFDWSHYWAHGTGRLAGTLVQCLPAGSAPSSQPGALERLRRLSAAMEHAIDGAEADSAFADRLATMSCDAAGSRDICEALVFDDGTGANRCEFTQATCRRNVDVLLDRLREVRIETIRESERLGLARQTYGRRVAFAEGQIDRKRAWSDQADDAKHRLLHRRARRVWALYGQFFAIMQKVEAEFRDRRASIRGSVEDDGRNTDEARVVQEWVGIDHANEQAVRSILRSVCGEDIWDAALASAEAGFRAPLLAAARAWEEEGDATNQVQRRSADRAKERVVEAVEGALARRPPVSALLRLSTYQDLLHAAQALRDAYRTRDDDRCRPGRGVADLLLDEKSARFLRTNDAQHAPAGAQASVPWLVGRLHLAALLHVAQLEAARAEHASRSTGPFQYAADELRERARPGELAALVLPRESARAANARYLAWLRRQRRPITGGSSALVQSAGPGSLSSSDMGLLWEMRSRHIRLNGPVRQGDYSAAARLLRRHIQLCLILAEEPSYETEEEGAMRSVADALRAVGSGAGGNKLAELLADPARRKQLTELQRSLSQRLMPRTQYVLETLVKKNIIRALPEDDAADDSGGEAGHLLIRVRNMANEERAFAVILPGGPGDATPKEEDGAPPYTRDSVPDLPDGRDFANETLRRHWREIVRLPIERTRRIQESSLPGILERARAMPRRSASAVLPRNRHAVRRLLAQTDEVYQFLTENMRTLAAQLHDKELDALFDKYTKENWLTEGTVEPERLREQWYRRVFESERGADLCTDSIMYMRQNSFTILMRESLGSMVDRYIDSRNQKALQEIEAVKSNLEDSLLFQTRKRNLAELLGKKITQQFNSGHTAEDLNHEIGITKAQIEKHQERYDNLNRRAEEQVRLQAALHSYFQNLVHDNKRQEEEKEEETEEEESPAEVTGGYAEAVSTGDLIMKSDPQSFSLDRVNGDNSDIQPALENKALLVGTELCLQKIGQNNLYKFPLPPDQPVVQPIVQKYVLVLEGQRIELHLLKVDDDDEYVLVTHDGTNMWRVKERKGWQPDTKPTWKRKTNSDQMTSEKLEFPKHLEYRYERVNWVLDYLFVLEKLEITDTPVSNVDQDVVNLVEKTYTKMSSKTATSSGLQQFIQKYLKDFQTSLKKKIVARASATSSKAEAPSGKSGRLYYQIDSAIRDTRPLTIEDMFNNGLLKSDRSHTGKESHKLIVLGQLLGLNMDFELTDYAREYTARKNERVGGEFMKLVNKLETQNLYLTDEQEKNIRDILAVSLLFNTEQQYLRLEKGTNNIYVTNASEWIPNRYLAEASQQQIYIRTQPEPARIEATATPTTPQTATPMTSFDLLKGRTLNAVCQADSTDNPTADYTKLSGGGNLQCFATPFARLPKVDNTRSTVLHGIKTKDGDIMVPEIFFDDRKRHLPLFASDPKTQCLSLTHKKKIIEQNPLAKLQDHGQTYELRFPTKIEKAEAGACWKMDERQDHCSVDVMQKRFESVVGENKCELPTDFKEGDIIVSYGDEIQLHESWDASRVKQYQKDKQNRVFLRPVPTRRKDYHKPEWITSDPTQERRLDLCSPYVFRFKKTKTTENEHYTNFALENTATRGDAGCNIQDGLRGWNWFEATEPRWYYLRQRPQQVYAYRGGELWNRTRFDNQGTVSFYDEVRAFRAKNMEKILQYQPGDSKSEMEFTKEGETWWYRAEHSKTVAEDIWAHDPGKQTGTTRKGWSWEDVEVGAELKSGSRLFAVVENGASTCSVREQGRSGVGKLTVLATDVNVNKLRCVLKFDKEDPEVLVLNPFPETNPCAMRQFLVWEDGKVKCMQSKTDVRIVSVSVGLDTAAETQEGTRV